MEFVIVAIVLIRIIPLLFFHFFPPQNGKLETLNRYLNTLGCLRKLLKIEGVFAIKIISCCSMQISTFLLYFCICLCMLYLLHLFYLPACILKVLIFSKDGLRCLCSGYAKIRFRNNFPNPGTE